MRQVKEDVQHSNMSVEELNEEDMKLMILIYWLFMADLVYIKWISPIKLRSDINQDIYTKIFLAWYLAQICGVDLF